ncbi:hypothetical protein ACFQL7_26305 [Halocatena marina]|uniref:Uncharacterized protein n=1 Tax=Halocatena marina TaxID=2934937 RepID=A0ABD5YYT8_9EURY
MGRFNDITLEELHEVCEQADGGSHENAFSRRSGVSRVIISIHSLSIPVLSRKPSAIGSIGSLKNRLSRLPTTVLGQRSLKTRIR